jgi:hypothetical protein
MRQRIRSERNSRRHHGAEPRVVCLGGLGTRNVEGFECMGHGDGHGGFGGGNCYEFWKSEVKPNLAASAARMVLDWWLLYHGYENGFRTLAANRS